MDFEYRRSDLRFVLGEVDATEHGEDESCRLSCAGLGLADHVGWPVVGP